jgi:hypothetical protein
MAVMMSPPTAAPAAWLTITKPSGPGFLTLADRHQSYV